MARCLFIVQGEGKGHLSQALALREYLEEAGHSVDRVLVGTGSSRSVPEYFSRVFADRLFNFKSPYLVRTPNQKGILIGKTLLLNLLRTVPYLLEIRRIRKEISSRQPDVVFNFYEGLGALAMRKVPSGIRRVGIGHHFFLHLENYQCRGGTIWHRNLLKFHTRLILRSCDKILALSFRKHPGDSHMEVIPPLIRRKYRDLQYRPGERYLAYFLNEGLFYDLVRMARELPDLQADVFSSLKPRMELPEGLSLHNFDSEKFSTLMAACRGMIVSAGFDAAAEAAYHGIPLMVIPTGNHFEQRCNAADIERSGVGGASAKMGKEMLDRMRTADIKVYRAWVDSARERVLKCVEE